MDNSLTTVPTRVPEPASIVPLSSGPLGLARWSRRKGQVQATGLSRQGAAIKGYAKASGYSIVREFADEGVSGAMEITDRPAFADMLKTLHANGVRTVLVERLDRLARDLMVQEAARSYFKEHGFTLMSVMEPDLMASDLSRIAFR